MEDKKSTSGKLNLQPMKQEEALYSYDQISQIKAQCGHIGYLRGDFGSGKEFYTAWFSFDPDRNHDEFAAIFDDTINHLRSSDDGNNVLKDLRSMRAVIRTHKATPLPGRWDHENQYGFRIDVGNYALLLRCHPYPGDYNFYCYCYDQESLDRHLSKARAGIRILLDNGQYCGESFRLRDGDSLYVCNRNGDTSNRLCRYIDECHFAFGHEIYHINQFSEFLQHTGSYAFTENPLLPQRCFSNTEITGAPIYIINGEKGYHEATWLDKGDAVPSRICVERENDDKGISRAVEEAMKAGSMFGWDSALANPACYDMDGNCINERLQKIAKTTGQEIKSNPINYVQMLTEKLEKDFQSYEEDLKKLPPDEILNRSYDYTIQKDVLFYISENPDLIEQGDAQLMLESGTSLSEIAGWHESSMSSYMEGIADTFSDCCFHLREQELDLEKPKSALEASLKVPQTPNEHTEPSNEIERNEIEYDEIER